MDEISETQRVLLELWQSRASAMTLPEIVGEEISRFTGGTAYGVMLDAEQYYRNRSDVQNKYNDVAKRSNTRIEHGVIRKLVDQKINYTLSRPFSVTGSRPEYSAALASLFDDTVRQKIKRFGRGAPKLGIGWMMPYLSNGKLRFAVLPATNVIPFWSDEEHTTLDGFLYFYDVVVYEGRTPKTITKAELWDASGVQYFARRSLDRFTVDPERPAACHFMVNGQGYNWKAPPLVWCRYNDEELPLQYFLKELADDVNWQTSVTSDTLRDVAKFIWVLKNYAGEDLAEFTEALRKYLVIKVDSDGGVDTIQPDPHVTSVLAFIEKQRRDIIDLGAGVDTKDPELGSASGRALYFRYMDLDTDSQNLQNELKAAFFRLKPFWDDYFSMIGKGDFHNDHFEVVFNTDMPVDEDSIFQNAQTARQIGVSLKTVLSNVPWVKDVDEELKQIALEQADALKHREQETKLLSGLDFPDPQPPDMPWDVVDT